MVQGGFAMMLKILREYKCAILSAAACLFCLISSAGGVEGKEIKILAAGDSITAGSYPSQLLNMLEEEGIAARVLNMGVPGATSGFYAEFVEKNKVFFGEYKPDFILLMLGTNDVRKAEFEGAHRYISKMREITELFREKIYADFPPEIIISTILPIFPGESELDEIFSERIRDEINTAVEELADELDLYFVDNYSLFEGRPELMPDGLHPCEEGNRRLANNWFGVIKSKVLMAEVKQLNTGIVYSDVFMEHDTGAGHPESPRRLQVIIEKLRKKNLLEEAILIEPRKAALERIAAVHSKDYIRKVEKASLEEAGYIHSPDTPVSAESYRIALYAAGGVLEAVDRIMKGEVKNVFCAIRPPGHHAMAERAMGFCLFNNIAIGAKYLLDEYGFERVAIIDWDVHHGNATQDMFYNTPEVLYISIHQQPLFPGTGNAGEKGSGEGYGYNLNFPLEAGAGDEQYMDIFKKEIIPALGEFRPEFILVSAGFDAHADDPLGGMEVTSEGFSDMTKMLKRVAEEICDGRIVSVLEGGYCLEGLADSVYKHVRALMD